jgi:predicted nucleic acid-binding protein
MRYLLDVSVLVAWGWSDHVDHARTAIWIAAARKQKTAELLTSAIPELGFVRVSVQRTEGRVTVEEASRTLAGMLDSLGACHVFLPSQTTDAHLLGLAEAHRARLATLDAGIPGAFLVPTPVDRR